MKKIAVFASGNGSNTENIINFFEENELARVALVISNKKKAGVVDKCKLLGVRCLVFSQAELENGAVLDKLLDLKIDFIALAGFLALVPKPIIDAFPQKIVNIHPGLLPEYGGKGMYGIKVHQAVVENEEEETGISIHYVNENFDEGEVIFEEVIEVDFEDSPEDLEYKVQQLEHQHYPQVLEYLIKDLE